jgi:hypothetical protein
MKEHQPKATKLDVHNASVSSTTFVLDENEVAAGGGRIPDNLAKLTMVVLKMHEANGDLAWVGDMVEELENISEADRLANMLAEMQANMMHLG